MVNQGYPRLLKVTKGHSRLLKVTQNYQRLPGLPKVTQYSWRFPKIRIALSLLNYFLKLVWRSRSLLWHQGPLRDISITSNTVDFTLGACMQLHQVLWQSVWAAHKNFTVKILYWYKYLVRVMLLSSSVVTIKEVTFSEPAHLKCSNEAIFLRLLITKTLSVIVGPRTFIIWQQIVLLR